MNKEAPYLGDSYANLGGGCPPYGPKEGSLLRKPFFAALRTDPRIRSEGKEEQEESGFFYLALGAGVAKQRESFLSPGGGGAPKKEGPCFSPPYGSLLGQISPTPLG